MSSTPFVLAASAEMLFVDRPVADRVRAIHDAGFAVEIWDWRNHDLDELEALAASGVVFTSMTGYTTGTLADEEGADELLRTAAESVVVSRRLGTPSLNLHGTGPRQPRPAGRARRRGHAGDVGHRPAHAGAHRRARRARGRHLRAREPQHRRRPPRARPSRRAADTLDLVRGVDSPHLRLNLDLYHAQIGEGNLIELCREALPWVAEVQVADVPGRCEPGTGEIRYAGVARALGGCRVHRCRRAGGLRERRPGCRARRLPRGLHPLTLPGGRAHPARPPGIRQWLSVRCSCAASRSLSSSTEIASPRARRTRSAWVCGRHAVDRLVAVEVGRERRSPRRRRRRRRRPARAASRRPCGRSSAG